MSVLPEAEGSSAPDDLREIEPISPREPTPQSPEALESERDPERVSKALASLRATKTRTGAVASQSDLHRVIRKYRLSTIDSVELGVAADAAQLVDVSPAEALDAGSEDIDIVKMFLTDARRYKPLPAEEHVRLARAIAIGRDAEATLAQDGLDEVNRLHLSRRVDEGKRAFEKFVASNLRLVVSVAQHYQNRGLDLPDLIQEGCFGLMRAVEGFDSSAGCQFSTYAYWWLKQTMSRAVANMSRAIRLPVHVYEALNRLRRANRELSSRLGREPTFKELAEHLSLPTEKVAALSTWLPNIASLDTMLRTDGAAVLADFLPATEPLVEDQVLETELESVTERLMTESLTTRQVDILKRRFGIGGKRPQTLEEIGDHLGVTRERVRQIEAKALKVLRHRAIKYRYLEGWA